MVALREFKLCIQNKALEATYTALRDTVCCFFLLSHDFRRFVAHFGFCWAYIGLIGGKIFDLGTFKRRIKMAHFVLEHSL